MKLTALSVAAMAAVVSSTAIDVTKRDTPLAVTLTPVSNSKVKAAVTNTGAEGYNIFYKGSFLDTKAPVDKLAVSSAGKYSARSNPVLVRHVLTISQPPKPSSEASSST